MNYHVFISSNKETLSFYVGSGEEGLAAHIGKLIALYEMAGSEELMSISIFPQIKEKGKVRGK